MSTPQIPEDDDKPLTLLQLLSSVFAALIGIQSEKNRERDFKKMQIKHVILCGVTLMILFFTLVFFVARSIIATHGS